MARQSRKRRKIPEWVVGVFIVAGLLIMVLCSIVIYSLILVTVHDKILRFIVTLLSSLGIVALVSFFCFTDYFWVEILGWEE